MKQVVNEDDSVVYKSRENLLMDQEMDRFHVQEIAIDDFRNQSPLGGNPKYQSSLESKKRVSAMDVKRH